MLRLAYQGDIVQMADIMVGMDIVHLGEGPRYGDVGDHVAISKFTLLTHER